MRGEPQDVNIRLVEDMLTNTPVLILYSLTVDNMLSADSSSYGLGAAILQKGIRGVEAGNVCITCFNIGGEKVRTASEGGSTHSMGM